MRARIAIDVEGDVVVVSVQGQSTLMSSIEAVMRGVWNAKRAQTRNILFDIRDSTSDDFHSRVMKQVSEAPRTGIGAFRVAVLGRPDDPRLPFVENVGVNRGYAVRCFVEKDSAIEWLHQGTAHSANAA